MSEGKGTGKGMHGPQRVSLSARLLIGLILFYRRILSPFSPGVCRYHPSCSAYALEAVRCHGGLTGARLAISRLLRCHPWGGAGYDPVPPADPPAKAS